MGIRASYAKEPAEQKASDNSAPSRRGCVYGRRQRGAASLHKTHPPPETRGLPGARRITTCQPCARGRRRSLQGEKGGRERFLCEEGFGRFHWVGGGPVRPGNARRPPGTFLSWQPGVPGPLSPPRPCASGRAGKFRGMAWCGRSALGSAASGTLPRRGRKISHSHIMGHGGPRVIFRNEAPRGGCSRSLGSEWLLGREGPSWRGGGRRPVGMKRAAFCFAKSGVIQSHHPRGGRGTSCA